MDFTLGEENERFRLHVRERIAELLPPDIKQRHCYIRAGAGEINDQRRWLSILNSVGWAAPAWPVEYGGTGWNALQRFIFEDELYAADAPEFHWSGTHMVGPVIYTFGSDAQKERFLPTILTAEVIWAQGFSEPGAGSDLVSLRTNARLDGDHYIVNGQKIWTSGAADSDWGFFLVKTDLTGKPQRSISFLLIDLKSPGITIRRIPQINGEAHLCEVFLDDVKVPADQLVGEPGQGWTYAKFLLEHERTASSFIYYIKRELRRVKDLARTVTADGKPLIENPAWAARIATLEANVTTHEWSVLRVLAGEQTEFSSAAGASALKVRGSLLQQDVTGLQVDLLGARAVRDFGVDPIQLPPNDVWPDIVPGRTGRALFLRAATIYGGSLQIQKNILARLALGL